MYASYEAQLNSMNWWLYPKGCSGGTPYWDPQQQACVADPGYVEKWYTLYTITQPGTYRLAVEATGFYGEYEYGLKLTDAASRTTCTIGAPSTASGTTTCPATDGPRIWSWNDMCVYFISNGTAVFNLGAIPAAYAGKTLDFSLFDPGDGSNVQDNCVLHNDPGAPLIIGKDVTIGHCAMLHGCRIADGALIGIQAVVLNLAVIGKHCLVGAGSIVAAGTLVPEGTVVPPGSLFMGHPGKFRGRQLFARAQRSRGGDAAGLQAAAHALGNALGRALSDTRAAADRGRAPVATGVSR